MGALQICETADTEDFTVYSVLSFNRCIKYSSTTRTIMDKYQISAYVLDYYEGHRVLECAAFSIDPVDTLDDVVTWIRSLNFKPDHIRINYKNGGCLFDNEDTRILNNVFYCNKFI